MPTPAEIIKQSADDRAAAGPMAIANNWPAVMEGIGASPRNWLTLNLAATAVERGWTRIVAALGGPTPAKGR